MTEQDIIDALTRKGICRREEIIGCNEVEIASVERFALAPLPRQYRVFLAAAGKSAPGFFTGTDFFFGQTGALNQSAAELLRENAEPFELPAGCFVFSMHQGYVFHYFMLDAGDDPPVFTYVEGGGPPQPAGDSFSDYLSGSIDWHERMRLDSLSYAASRNPDPA